MQISRWERLCRKIGDIKHDSAFIIIDRNINLINRYLDKLFVGQSNLEIKNIIRDCINAVAMMEKEDVTAITTEQGINLRALDNTAYDDILFKQIQKEYMKLTNSIVKMFEDRNNKLKLEKQSETDFHLEPLKAEGDIHIEQSESKQEKYKKIEQMKKVDKIIDGLNELSKTNLEQSKMINDILIEQSKSKPEKYKNIWFVIFLLLLFVGPGFIFAYTIKTPDAPGLFIMIIYFIMVIGFRYWLHKVRYLKFPTKEEREAEKEDRMRKWGGPIKSAHLIRLERGLYTGLGNRRPYPHGRRTKKYGSSDFVVHKSDYFLSLNE